MSKRPPAARAAPKPTSQRLLRWYGPVGAVLVLVPESRDFRLQPYFWVLIAMVLFEAGAYARGRGAAAAIITVQTLF